MSSSSSQSNGVHFFKIIKKTNLLRGDLRVPTSFVKKYWEGMSNPVTLSLPNKTEWKVSWKKDDGDIWLCNNGWKEFAKHVSLSVSQFVVFHFEDNSCFNVIVLAKNGLEIKYPSTSDAIIAAVAEEKQQIDCSLKILDHPPSLPAKRSKSSPQSSRPHKKSKTNPKDQKECHHNKPQSSQLHKMKKTANGKKKVEAHTGFNNAAKHMSSGSSSKDLKKRMKDFHQSVKKDLDSNKEFFTCAIKKTYLERDRLIIPNEFSRLHLRKMVGRSATLFVDDQNRTWNVKLKQYNNHINFVGGWKKFSIDNNLNTGDVCAFLLTKTKELSFQVVNHPFKNDISSPHSQGSKNDMKKRINEKVKNDFLCDKDFFTCVMSKTYVTKDQMNLPHEFSKLHLHEMDGRSVTLFDVNKKRTWDVQLKKRFNGQFAFASGWIKFSRDNNLKIGDVCAFVFIKSKLLVLSFQVHHFPLKKETRTPLFEVNNSDQKELLNRPSSSSLSPHRKPNSPKVGCKWLSDQKEFVVNITKSPSQMTIPIKYIKNFISESGKIVTFRIGENSWPVKVLLYEYERHSRAKFSQGWSKFIKDCQLKEGDSCCFKMVDEDKLEFEVIINFNKMLN